MTSVLILQNEIMQYRKPVYNALWASFDVTVLHSGLPSVSEGDCYREVLTPQRRHGPFHFQPTSPLNELIAKHDVVIAMFDLRWPRYLAPLFWKRRPKFVLWGHWYSTNELANVARDRLMQRADRVLMYGGEEIDRMVERGIDRCKIVVAPNTIEVPGAADLSGSPKSSFLFIGRLQGGSRRNSKRADLLITSFAKLQGRIDEKIVVHIVGEGEEKEALKRLAMSLGVPDKVFFHGHQDDPAILSHLFARAIALVSPGHVGLSVLQSFGHGVPVVTGKAVQQTRETQHLYNVATGTPVIMGPEYYNLRHNENAYLFETEEDLVAVLDRLSNEPSYAAKLGHNAYRYYIDERPLSRMLEGFRKAIEE
jgi:glycosyltransferase involved in cell wall biosynthesis